MYMDVISYFNIQATAARQKILIQLQALLVCHVRHTSRWEQVIDSSTGVNIV